MTSKRLVVLKVCIPLPLHFLTMIMNKNVRMQKKRIYAKQRLTFSFYEVLKCGKKRLQKYNPCHPMSMLVVIGMLSVMGEIRTLLYNYSMIWIFYPNIRLSVACQ